MVWGGYQQSYVKITKRNQTSKSEEKAKYTLRCKKSAEMERVEWIIELVKDQGKADQDPEGESKMKKMLQTIREEATNRKVTAILKRPHHSVQSLDMAEIKWFHSLKKIEFYRFNDGVFEAQPYVEGNEYWKHYPYKVPHDEYKEVTVAETVRERYMVNGANHSQLKWRKLTKPMAVNATLL
jgi:hypothetical protein